MGYGLPEYVRRAAKVSRRATLSFVEWYAHNVGIDWLHDTEAERVAIAAAWHLHPLPTWLKVDHFVDDRHKLIFGYTLKWRKVIDAVDTPGKPHITADLARVLICAAKFGDATRQDGVDHQIRLLGQPLVGALEQIEQVGLVHAFHFDRAMERVEDLALRRRALHCAMRLGLTLEEATLDMGDVQKEFQNLRTCLNNLWEARKRHGG